MTPDVLSNQTSSMRELGSRFRPEAYCVVSHYKSRDGSMIVNQYILSHTSDTDRIRQQAELECFRRVLPVRKQIIESIPRGPGLLA